MLPRPHRPWQQEGEGAGQEQAEGDQAGPDALEAGPRAAAMARVGPGRPEVPAAPGVPSSAEPGSPTEPELPGSPLSPPTVPSRRRCPPPVARPVPRAGVNAGSRRELTSTHPRLTDHDLLSGRAGHARDLVDATWPSMVSTSSAACQGGGVDGDLQPVDRSRRWSGPTVSVGRQRDGDAQGGQHRVHRGEQRPEALRGAPDVEPVLVDRHRAAGDRRWTRRSTR